MLHQAVIVAIAFYVVGMNLTVIEKYLAIVLTSLVVIGVLLLLIRQIGPLKFFFGMRPKRK